MNSLLHDHMHIYEVHEKLMTKQRQRNGTESHKLLSSGQTGSASREYSRGPKYTPPERLVVGHDDKDF